MLRILIFNSNNSSFTMVTGLLDIVSQSQHFYISLTSLVLVYNFLTTFMLLSVKFLLVITEHDDFEK